MHIDSKSGIFYTGKANNRLRKKQEEEIKKQLLSEADTKLSGQREHYEAAKRQLEEEFLQKKDTLAEEIFESIISP